MDMETGKPSSRELCCVSGCAVWGWGCLEDQGSKAPRVSVSDVVQLSEAPKAFCPVPEVLSLERRWNADRALVFATGKTELAKQTAKYIHKDVKKVKLLSPVLVAMCAAGRPQPRIRRQRWAEGAQLLSVEEFSIESFGLRTKQTGARPSVQPPPLESLPNVSRVGAFAWRLTCCASLPGFHQTGHVGVPGEARGWSVGWGMSLGGLGLAKPQSFYKEQVFSSSGCIWYQAQP